MIKVKMKLADIVVEFRSKFPEEIFTPDEDLTRFADRFEVLMYKGKRRPDIIIDVCVVKKLPELSNASIIYVTYNPDDQKECWRMSKQGNRYVYTTPIEEKRQVVFVNRDFDHARAYLPVHEEKGFVWNVDVLIYDFLQILLINYLAKRGQGLIAHAVGIKDNDGHGWLFAGKSGNGKSTMARIWHKNSTAAILNDDRVFVRKIGKKFFIYGSPWHGDFGDFLKTSGEIAQLKEILFIHHSDKNKIKPLDSTKAFHFLYPAIIPVFWDKDLILSTIAFGRDMLESILPFRVGFVKGKSIIDFIRRECPKNK